VLPQKLRTPYTAIAKLVRYMDTDQEYSDRTKNLIAIHDQVLADVVAVAREIRRFRIFVHPSAWVCVGGYFNFRSPEEGRRFRDLAVEYFEGKHYDPLTALRLRLNFPFKGYAKAEEFIPEEEFDSFLAFLRQK